MEFRDTRAQAAFRREVRDFIHSECPPELRGKISHGSKNSSKPYIGIARGNGSRRRDSRCCLLAE